MREKTKLFYFCKMLFENVLREATRPKTKEAKRSSLEKMFSRLLVKN